MIVSEQLVEYGDLSEEAQTQARKSFILFYIRQFKNDNLEEIANVANDRDLSMVNHLLGENRFETAEQLLPLCEKMVPASFDAILKQLSMKYNQNGESEKAWPAWYQEIHAQLPVED